MDQTRATDLAQNWLNAWNAHDADGVVAHFADDVVFTSHVATQLLPETGGVLRGKAAVRAYFAAALAKVPELHFELIGVYTGVDHVVINYRNHRGGLVCEVLRFAGELAVEGHGTYLSDDAAGASGIST